MKTWTWRKNYRVWEANRTIFIYPENWIVPEQRPDSRTQFQLDDVVKTARGQRTSVLLTSAKPAATVVAGSALAAALGRDLYYVDLRRVISKYIGETEKNIDRVFAAAAKLTVVLLFDEADALFGKRADAADSDDRAAYAELGYLLERIAAFEGLAALATNASRRSVATHLRRFAFVIDQAAVEGDSGGTKAGAEG